MENGQVDAVKMLNFILSLVLILAGSCNSHTQNQAKMCARRGMVAVLFNDHDNTLVKQVAVNLPITPITIQISWQTYM